MKKWFSLLLLIIPVIILFLINFNKMFTINEYEVLKDQSELISWIYSGIISLIGFLGLFIGFSYENKLISASKELRQFFHPYTLDTNSLRLLLNNYQQLTSRDRLLKFIYWVFLIVSCSSILVWGAILGFYTKYRMALEFNLSLEAVLNFGIYLSGLLLIGILVSVTFALNLVRHQKDPLGKGYLPEVGSLCDLDFLFAQEADIHEILKKLSPIIEFYKNPPVDDPKFEMNFHLPLKMNNFRFTLKIICPRKDEDLIIRCFGLINEIKVIGERFITLLDSDLPKELYSGVVTKEAYGEFKLYNAELDVISRYTLKKTEEGTNCIKFELDKPIKYPEIHNIDKGILKRLKQNEQVGYSYEISDSN